LFLYHALEGQNLQALAKGTADAKPVTLSFWVKSSKTGASQVNMRDADNTRVIGSSYSISSANTWEYKTVTFSGDTTGSFDNDNAKSLQLEWWLDAGTNYTSGSIPTSWQAVSNGDLCVDNLSLGDSTSNTWQITGVQLEVGDTATPFEHRSYSDEIQRCHRYYYKIGGVSGKRPVICNAMAYSTGELYGVFRLPVPMRTLPSGSYDGLPRGYKPGTAQRLTAFVINSIESSVQELRLRGDNAGYFNAGDASWIQIDSNGEYLDFDAEL
jgi:hypothetical protein